MHRTRPHHAGGYLKASDAGTYLNAAGAYHELRQTANDSGVIVTGINASLTNDVLQVRATRNTTNNTFFAINYFNDGAAAYRFRVADSGNVTNTNNSYGAISDEKVKQDIVDAASQWADIKGLRVRKFRYKNAPDAPLQIGLVAQEAELVSPGIVDAAPDYEEVEVEVAVEKTRAVLDADGAPVLGEDGEPLTETYTEMETRTERQATARSPSRSSTPCCI
jgi:hypothetical protein